MSDINQEKRKSKRFGTQANVFFQVTHSPALDPNGIKIFPARHSGFSKNVSATGLCFTSNKKPESRDRLKMEISIPGIHRMVNLTGEVRWAKESSVKQWGEPAVDTGVRLISIDGRSLLESYRYDENRNIIWSRVIEAVLGRKG